jgi:hypothetical protein
LNCLHSKTIVQNILPFYCWNTVFIHILFFCLLQQYNALWIAKLLIF